MNKIVIQRHTIVHNEKESDYHILSFIYVEIFLSLNTVYQMSHEVTGKS